MKKLSIIVPCYNVEKYVGRCLDSLIAQDSKELLILAINDGSTDSTASILDSYKEKYPEIIHVFHRENCGIAETRNFGLSQVETAYFGFLDSDDYVEKTMFSEMLTKLEETNADLVVCGFEWNFEYAPKKNYVTIEGPYEPGKQMMLSLFATLWNKVYRTEFIKNTGLKFPTGYRYEDASFLYRLVPHVKKVEFIDKPFISYVQREGSITHTHNERVKDMVHVFDDILKYYQDHHFYEQYKNELEYIFIRFFLGNSFLRTVQIKDKADRELTLNLSWKMLDENFPNWKKNSYLKQPGLKNIYYRLINRRNYTLFGKIFTILKK